MSRRLLAVRAVPRSEATSAARRRGERAGIEPAMRSVIQRKMPPSAASMMARKAMRPSAMRQYRLRYQRGLDICRFIACSPHGQNDLRLRGIALDLLAHPLDQRVHAPHRHEGLILPDLAEERFATEHDARSRNQHVEELELVERELHITRTDEDAPSRRV